MLDKDRVITEVAAKDGIRVGRHDPFFAAVTVMQLGLEDSLGDVEEKFRAIIAAFEASVKVTERRAGKVLAQEVKDCVAEVRRGLESDVAAAGLKARELVQSVHEAHERPTRIFWASVGLLSALASYVLKAEQKEFNILKRPPAGK